VFELGDLIDDMRPLHRLDVLEGGKDVFLALFRDDQQDQVDFKIGVTEYFCLGPGFEEIVDTPLKALDVFPLRSILFLPEVADLLAQIELLKHFSLQVTHRLP
jgi:hypothetical protein